MLNVDDYVTGHENDQVEFNLNGFQSDIQKWLDNINDDLTKNPYDITCLCVREVLGTVRDLIYENTIINYEYDI